MFKIRQWLLLFVCLFFGKVASLVSSSLFELLARIVLVVVCFDVKKERKRKTSYNKQTNKKTNKNNSTETN